MPASVDHPAVREQVRVLYFANGRNLTLAAKTAGIPVDRAEKWKERGRWDQQSTKLDVSESVGKVASNVASHLASTINETRERLADIALRSARKAKDVSVESVKDLRDLGATIQQLGPGWEARNDQAAGLAVNILIVNGDNEP